jgi:hypothetical protein
MLKIVIALILLAHGIGHSMGPLQVLKVATINPQWHGDSWLLGGVMGIAPSQAVGVALWAAALVGFVGLAAVVMGWAPAGWWQPLAVASAIASLGGLVLFPAAFPTMSTVGALLVDVAVLAAVLGLQWVPADLPA